MATKIITIAQILDRLNQGISTRPWVVLPGTFIVQSSKVEGMTISKKEEGMVLKAFYNKETGEFKTFVAKVTDEPETNLLP